jgi:hypothetical protein
MYLLSYGATFKFEHLKIAGDLAGDNANAINTILEPHEQFICVGQFLLKALPGKGRSLGAVIGDRNDRDSFFQEPQGDWQ